MLGVTSDISLRLMRGFPEFLDANGWEVHVVCSPGPVFDKNARNKAVHFHALEMHRNPTLLHDIRALADWVRLCREVRPDLISAGTPIGAFGQQENPFSGETLNLPQDLVPGSGDLYALQVKGDSMIDALVYDGDWVVIRHQQTAQPRDMVVAWIKDREETTLKYYYPEGPMVRLQPANPAYQPIPVPADQLEIQGKVVLVIRQLD